MPFSSGKIPMNERNPWVLLGVGALLAAGMIGGSAILASHFKTLGAGRQSITVKGLAEKPVQADMAEWSVGVAVHGERFGDTLEALRQARPQLDQFLADQGFAATDVSAGPESIEAHHEYESLPQGGSRNVQKGFDGTQELVVRSNDLAKIDRASKAVIELRAAGKPVVYASPSYLIKDLETVKMSLIGAATRNARQRAEEFAKVGDARVGAMRSASQGAFYILASDGEEDASDYGGVYDKTTVNKKARVVVTIEYAIE
jgi:uncharacterized protein